MTREMYRRLEDYMEQCMSDSAHDREHVRRVLYQALEIAKREEQGVNTDILIAACLLHDIGRREQLEDPGLCHAEVGSEKAGKFLRAQGFSDPFAAAVEHCIRSHRFSRRAPPESMEAKILYDADKLDVTGAMGIARTLMYQGELSRPLYSLSPEGTVSDGREDRTASFLQEYHRKLRDLYGGFYTRSGEALARERQAAARDFYERLYAEAAFSYAGGREALEQALD